MIINEAPAAKNTYDNGWDGMKVIVAQAAKLPIKNRKDGADIYTDVADHLLLEDNTEMYVCTEPGCTFGSSSTQGIIVGHRPSKHPELIRKNPVTGGRINWAELSKLTLAEIAEGYMATEAKYEALLDRFNKQIEATGDMRVRAVKAEKELAEYRKAMEQLFGKINTKV